MNEFPIPSNTYLSFDGLSVKEKIRQRLIQTGVFTDQNFEGSNISALNDMIAMVCSLLLYNLSKTANEGLFTEAQLYENVSRIVKQLDYKPVGYQTSTLNFTLTANSNISIGNYTIPRYSYVSIGNIRYSLTKDYSFLKSSSGNQVIDTSNNDVLLYQGTVVEHPLYTAQGINNELIILTPTNSSDKIDHFNIHVYVKDSSGVWSEWTKTQSLYLNNSISKVYEIRFNENKKYEIKFGNDINGKALIAGESVAVYYTKSNGISGEVGVGAIQGKTFTAFNSSRLTAILSDISSQTYNTSILSNLLLDNTCKSTYYSEPENVTSIKENAPANFRSQYSLVVPSSYETFVKSNFANIIQDVKCVNNSTYIDTYQKYFYDLGLNKPELESRALFNQLKMSDSCNFNNIYLYIVPKTIGNTVNYLNASQKKLIVDTIQEEKILTSEIVVSDPVYIAIDLALSDSNTVLISDITDTVLVVEKNYNTRRNDSSIIEEVASVIDDYFNRRNFKLGQTIDVLQLTANILSIDGIKKIYTKNSNTQTQVDGIRLLAWNDLYGDISSSVISGNKKLEDYQFPYFYSTMKDRIVVI